MRIGNEERLKKIKYDTGKTTLAEIRRTYDQLTQAGKHPRLTVKRGNMLIEYRE